MKTATQMERHFKGIANHWRIEILLLLSREENLSLDKISKTVGANIKTIGEHLHRLHHAGLINKKYRGREVHHSLSPYGKKIVSFIKTFQKIPSHP